MKNISHKNNWFPGAIQLHIDPSPMHIIKRDTEMKKVEAYLIKVKLHRNLNSVMLDIYYHKWLYLKWQTRGVPYFCTGLPKGH